MCKYVEHELIRNKPSIEFLNSMYFSFQMLFSELELVNCQWTYDTNKKSTFELNNTIKACTAQNEKKNKKWWTKLKMHQAQWIDARF